MRFESHEYVKDLKFVLMIPNMYFLFQFTRTLVCQGHLTPLPLHVSPVYWAYDCGLRLYPLPDLVICADKHDPFNSSTLECTVMNPVSTIYSNICIRPNKK